MNYTRFQDNVHIADTYESIPIENLSLNDYVFLISKNPYDENQIINFNTRLVEMDGKIYKFLNTENKGFYNGDVYTSATTTYYRYPSNEIDKFILLELNNKLIYICNEKNKRGGFDTPFDKEFFAKIYKDYFQKNLNKIITRTFKPTKGENKNSLYAYMTYPLNNDVTIFFVSMNRYSDYVLFVKHPKDKDQKDEFLLAYSFWNSYTAYSQNMEDLKGFFGGLDPNDKEVQKFKDIIFATKYELRDYLRDENKETNIKRAVDILKSININEHDLYTYYAPKYEIKGFKAYSHHGDIYFTFNDEYIEFNSGPAPVFEDRHYGFTMNGIEEYVAKLPECLKSKVNQTNYQIAYAMVEFQNKQEGINPVTGDLYIKGTIDNSKIDYKDDQGIIVDARYDTFYVKKKGFYLVARNEQQINQIKERKKVMETLKNAQ